MTVTEKIMRTIINNKCRRTIACIQIINDDQVGKKTTFLYSRKINS